MFGTSNVKFIDNLSKTVFTFKQLALITLLTDCNMRKFLSITENYLAERAVILNSHI